MTEQNDRVTKVAVDIIETIKDRLAAHDVNHQEFMAAGAFGFTTTFAGQHVGFKGRPLACRLASHDELRAYGGVLKELGLYTVKIHMGQEVNADLKVWVVPTVSEDDKEKSSDEG